MPTHPALPLLTLLALLLARGPTPLAAGEPPREPLRPVSVGQAGRLAQVIWTGTEFVAVGGISVLTSPDGAHWSAVTLPKETRGLLSVASNGKMFVAVGDGGLVASSPDLKTWTVHALTTRQKLSSVFWLGDRFLLLGDGGTNATSPDGLTWSEGVSLGNFFYTHGTSKGPTVVVGAGNAIFRSTDGATFTRPINNVGRMHDVAWGGGLYVAVGEPRSGVLVSTDGVAWSRANPGVATALRGVHAAGAEFIAVGERGVVLASADGLIWKPIPADTRAATLTSITGNGTTLVAVGDKGEIFSTNAPPAGTQAAYVLTPLPPVAPATIGTPADGPLDHWTGVHKQGSRPINQITWLDGQFAAVTWAAVATSRDGVTWRSQSVGSRQLFGLAGNGTLHVVVGERGEIFSSPDLVAWTARTSGTSQRLFDAFWTGQEFLALGDNGTLVTSPDGVSWTLEKTNVSDNFHHGIWTGSQFVVANYAGLLVSNFGRAWTATSLGAEKIAGAAWNGTLYVAVAANRRAIYTSGDARTWTVRENAAGSGFNDVAWAGGRFIAAGRDGGLASSENGEKWSYHAFTPGIDLTAVAGHDGTVVLGAGNGMVYANQSLDAVATPVISLQPAADGAPPQIALASPKAGAKIFYTTDGSEPSSASTPYAGPFAPGGAAVVKARAYAGKNVPSGVAGARYGPPPASASPPPPAGEN